MNRGETGFSETGQLVQRDGVSILDVLGKRSSQ